MHTKECGTERTSQPRYAIKDKIICILVNNTMLDFHVSTPKFRELNCLIAKTFTGQKSCFASCFELQFLRILRSLLLYQDVEKTAGRG